MSYTYVKAFTDGACKKSGIGGWGFVAWTNTIKNGDPIGTTLRWSDHGGTVKTTNQRMELTAMAEFLEFCPMGSCAHVYSDSMYTLGGVVENTKKPCEYSYPLKGWMKGWVVYPGVNTPVSRWKSEPKNPDLWLRINESLRKHHISNTKITFEWVKGHSGVEGNEIADQLANIFPAEMGEK